MNLSKRTNKLLVVQVDVRLPNFVSPDVHRLDAPELAVVPREKWIPPALIEEIHF